MSMIPLHRTLHGAALAVLALAAAACSGADPTSPPSEFDALGAPVARDGSAAPARPFHLDGGAALAGQVFAPDFGPPRFGRSDFDGRCSMPSDFSISFTVHGHATHLGTFTGFAEHCTQIDFATGLSTITDGHLTLVSADGDELWTTYVRGAGVSVPEIHTVVGGTGRFAGAWGELRLHAWCDRSTGTCTVAAEGTLGYAAGDRAQG